MPFDMPKHELKAVVDEFAPQCFSAGAFAPEDLRFTVTLDDSVVRLRKFGFKMQRHPMRHETFSIDVLVDMIFGHVPALLKRATCYAAVFDKPGCVTQAKQPEQRQRDAKIQTTHEAADPQHSDYWAGEMDLANALRRAKTASAGKYSNVALSAREWDRSISNRDSRNDTIRILCHRAAEVLPGMLQRADVPPDHLLILDFEGFKSEDQVTPIVITCDGVQPDRSSEFRNSLGEFDVAAAHYLHHPTVSSMVRADQQKSPEEAVCCVLIDSIDTDLLIISSLNCDREVDTHEVPPIRVKTTLSKPARDVFFDPSALCDWLQTVLVHVPEKERVQRFAHMYAIAGSDFVQGQKGLSNARALRLFLEQQGKCLPHEIMRSQASGTSGMTQGLLSLGSFNGPGGVTGNCFRGTKRASASTQNEDATLQYRDQRAKFSVNYWRHSAWQKTEKAYVSPLGHGFALGPNAQVVYTEDLLGSGASTLQGVTEEDRKRSRCA